MNDDELVAAARAGDRSAFDRLIASHRGELRALCYRMLGSLADADDALQEALFGAWRGIGGFEGRSTVRTWLYRITTHACLRVAGQRSRRRLASEYPAIDVHNLGEPVTESVWLEPCPDALLDPGSRYEQRESVELAFIAALQLLPATQRAVLILRDVLAFTAAEVAEALDTSVAAANSALQRARDTVNRARGASQRAALDALGDAGRRALVDAFVAAWTRADVPAILGMLVEDARFTMPPLPAWFHGRAAIAAFMTERMFKLAWRIVPIQANGQIAFACYSRTEDGEQFRLTAINLLAIRDGQIAEINAFLDEAILRRFELPEFFDPDR